MSYEPYDSSADSELWRDQMSSRVSRYRARKRRRSEGSLSLNFDGAAAPQLPVEPEPEPPVAKPQVCDTEYYRRANQETFSPKPVYHAPEELLAPPSEPVSPAVELCASPLALPQPELDPAFAFERETVSAPEPQPEPDAELMLVQPLVQAVSEPVAAPEPEPEPMRRKVIVFPRPLVQPPMVEPPARDELAEAITRMPRILDVPENLVPTVDEPLFAEVHIDAGDEPVSDQARIEVPIPVAFIGPRCAAALVDLLVVGVSTALFAALNREILLTAPHTKYFWGALGALPAMMWAAYEYVFMTWSGQTPGMSLLRLQLGSFDGEHVRRGARRRRALATLLSAASLGMGFLWALVDEDLLCWHDRMTHTFVTPESSTHLN